MAPGFSGPLQSCAVNIRRRVQHVSLSFRFCGSSDHPLLFRTCTTLTSSSFTCLSVSVTSIERVRWNLDSLLEADRNPFAINVATPGLVIYLSLLSLIEVLVSYLQKKTTPNASICSCYCDWTKADGGRTEKKHQHNRPSKYRHSQDAPIGNARTGGFPARPLDFATTSEARTTFPMTPPVGSGSEGTDEPEQCVG